ncbi:class I glutamine amidotransferase-like protein [Mycena amicta]|nr:class I glutamine amidotransferase-like protein [Mycena amicta]
MLSAAVLIADGTEEMEFTITYDTLVRAGVSCHSLYVQDPGVSASQQLKPYATCSRGVRIMYDATLDAELNNQFDALVIPGGAKGADTLSKNPAVQQLVREYLKQGKIVGMICAGSLAALTAGLARQAITSHPSVKEQLESEFDYSEEPVVVSGNLVTSRGPGTSFPFALTLVSLLCGTEKRAEVQSPMVFPPGTPF